MLPGVIITAMLTTLLLAFGDNNKKNKKPEGSSFRVIDDGECIVIRKTKK